MDKEKKSQMSTKKKKTEMRIRFPLNSTIRNTKWGKISNS